MVAAMIDAPIPARLQRFISGANDLELGKCRHAAHPRVAPDGLSRTSLAVTTRGLRVALMTSDSDVSSVILNGVGGAALTRTPLAMINDGIASEANSPSNMCTTRAK